MSEAANERLFPGHACGGQGREAEFENLDFLNPSLSLFGPVSSRSLLPLREYLVCTTWSDLHKAPLSADGLRLAY